MESDDWLWDERGYIAYTEGSMTAADKERYLAISQLRENAICHVCGRPAKYRYAPHDGVNNRAEKDRWRCEEHKPFEATDEGWNGEWDFYEHL